MLPFAQSVPGYTSRYAGAGERGRRRDARYERYDVAERAPASTIFFSKPTKPKEKLTLDFTPSALAAESGLRSDSFDVHLEEEASECFRLYDRDGDGLVLVTEVTAMLRSLGFVVLVEQHKVFEAEMRRLKVTSINFETFLSIARKGFPKAVDPVEILAAFNLLDREKKGSVNTEELHHLMTTVGDPLSEADWQKLLMRTLTTRESAAPVSIKRNTFLTLVCDPVDGESEWAASAPLHQARRMQPK
ncbi:calmodulin, putative [Eimeria necatrix]|uniref:Calmodulin n=1 Tax=Eimeria necatrix TaxID=51315 RepID=U6MM59_9EIME|nr:calmodulin, putative [Eimeria necatrix]CDJ63524.1 calmodulin, putative [Eimeria necatrix]